MSSVRKITKRNGLAAADCISDLRERAGKRLPRMVFDYIDGAADSEVTARRNTDAFEKISILPRVLSPTPDCNTSTSVLDQSISFPVLVAPTGFSSIVWPSGELEVARAAARAGTVMLVSAASNMRLEDIAKASMGPKWFQLFIYKDRQITLDLARRAKSAGYKGLVVTLDVQAPGHRRRDGRNGFTIPPRLGVTTAFDLLRRPGWCLGMLRQPSLSFPNFEGYGRSGLLSVAEWQQGLIDPTVSWEDITWLRSHWDGPLILKGITHPEDARLAIASRANAIVVSNHGGRQLDSMPATIDILPSIVAAVGGRVPVLIDSGIRSGTDVLKCLALGATACLVGRACLWGLAAGGEDGAFRALSILKSEMERALALCGRNSVLDLDRDLVRFPD